MSTTLAGRDATNQLNMPASPGQFTVLPGQKPDGSPILSVLLKRTYSFAQDGQPRRAQDDMPLLAGDQFYQSPMNSSVKLEADFVPFKLATDVVVHATAIAPGGTPCHKLIAAVTVADTRKELLVIGDRKAIHASGSSPRFTDPVPFTHMELKYERAYGGCDVRSFRSVPHPYPRNPVGRGFVIANARESVDNLQLPNIEDPVERLTPDGLCIGEFRRWEQQPLPAGLGWFGKNWMPRAGLAGIMPGDRQQEQEMRKLYAQLVPPEQRDAYDKTQLKDMDFRYFNGASLGLSLPYLQGGEKVRTEHLTSESICEFTLPSDRPGISLDIGQGAISTEVVMHTVMIDMQQRTLNLVWRGAIDYPGMDWLPQMKKMQVTIQ